MVNRKSKQAPASSSTHFSARKYGLVFLSLGILLMAIALFINVMYIRPTNFKAQFRERQLQACLKTSTDAAVCRRNFAE